MDNAAVREKIEVREAVRRLVERFSVVELPRKDGNLHFEVWCEEIHAPGAEPPYLLALRNAERGHELSAELSALEDFFIQLLSSEEGEDGGSDVG